MDRDTTRPLTPAEAKARLRTAAQGLTLSHWIGRRPWHVLAATLLGGFVVGRLRLSTVTQSMLMQRIAPLLLSIWSQRLKDS